MKEYNWKEEKLRSNTGNSAPKPAVQPIAPLPVRKSRGPLVILLLLILGIGAGAAFYFKSDNKNAAEPVLVKTAADDSLSVIQRSGETTDILQPQKTENPGTDKTDDTPNDYIQGILTPSESKNDTGCSFVLYSENVTENTRAEILKTFSWLDCTHIKKWLQDNKNIGLVFANKNGKDIPYWGKALVSPQEIENSTNMKTLSSMAKNTYNYFLKEFNFYSYDNKNGKVLIHYPLIELRDNGTINPNAVSWGRVENGTFLPVFAFSAERIKQHTMTHEFTHKVTDTNINFTESVGECGTLNEAFSDIFAGLHYSKLYPDKPVEERWHTSTYRYIPDPWKFKCPEKYQDQYWGDPTDHSLQNDYGCIHDNSTVFTRVAFLLCEGQTADKSRNRGAVSPIGLDKTTQLFWQLHNKESLPGNQGFSDFAQKLYTAAENCNFSKAELECVIAACKEANLPNCENLEYFTYSKNGINIRIKLNNASNLPPEKIQIQKVSSTEDFRTIFNRMELGTVSVKSSTLGRRYQAEQKINGIPVYGTRTSVSTDNHGNIQKISAVSSAVKVKFDTPVKEFPEKLKKQLCGNNSRLSLVNFRSMIFDPAVVHAKGEAKLVWTAELAVDGIPAKRYLISQKDNLIVREVPLFPPPEPERRNR